MATPELVAQGQIRWHDFGEARGSEPSGYRPALVVQGDHLNHSKWSTTVVAPLTTNVSLAAVPGGVLIPARVAGLERDSVVMLNGMTTVDKSILGPVVGQLPLILWEGVLRAIDSVTGRVKGSV